MSLQLMTHMFITSYEQIINFARHEYERVGVFRIMMISLIQKLKPLEK